MPTHLTPLLILALLAMVALATDFVAGIVALSIPLGAIALVSLASRLQAKLLRFASDGPSSWWTTALAKCAVVGPYAFAFLIVAVAVCLMVAHDVPWNVWYAAFALGVAMPTICFILLRSSKTRNR